MPDGVEPGEDLDKGHALVPSVRSGGEVGLELWGPRSGDISGRRSHMMKTESGREECERRHAADGEAERVRAEARKLVRPRRQGAEKAGEEGVEEAKKTLGELGMAAGWPVFLPCA